MTANQVSGVAIVTLGIGTVLLTDEGTGGHATQFPEHSRHLDGVSFIGGGTSSLAISAKIEAEAAPALELR